MKLKNKKTNNKSSFFEWIEAISVALVVVILFRFFCFDLFVVPTTSMEGGVLAGDFVLVDKFTYGARMPITPLSIPFMHQNMPFFKTIKSYSEIVRLPYARFLKTGNINRNDLVVFNYPLEFEHPIDQSTFYIKRCIALPRDKLEIIAKETYCNDMLLPSPQQAKFQFHVKLNSPKLDIDSLTGVEGGRISNQGDWQLNMTLSQATKLSNKNFVDHVIRTLDKPNEHNNYTFPQALHYKWSKDFFGPLVIPAKGDSVKLAMKNLPLYAKIIEDYESNKLEILEDSIIYIQGVKAKYYTFKMNYYFMLGDNRDNSDDSRFWGFVPESHIVGKATHTLFSVDKSEKGLKGRFRWNRFFNRLE